MHLGLESKARTIYEALIIGGTTSIADIAQRTGIKRPTVYVHLYDLVQQGLAERVTINAHTRFRACDPERLYQQLAVQKEHVDTLSALYKQQQSSFAHSGVRVFEGFHHLEQIYKDVLTANSVVAWFGVSDSATLFTRTAYAIADHVRENKVNFRDIIPNDQRSIAYARRMQRMMGPTYSYRVIPEHTFENDVLVYGNKIVMIRRRSPDLYATVIEDPSFANTFRVMFETSWKLLPKPASSSVRARKP